MSLLALLWWSSILLAALALLWMAGLVIARLFRANGEAQRAADRQAVIEGCLAIMGGAGDASARLTPYIGRARLMAEALLEMLALVRGPERERLISSLVGLHVDDRLRARLGRGGKAGRLAAIEALAAFNSPATRQMLEKTWGNAKDPEIRVAAVRTLIDLGATPRVSDLLLDLGRHGETRSLLYAPLMQRMAVEAPDDMLAMLDRPELSDPARALVAEAIGASGDYRAMDRLMRYAIGDSLALRIAALRALASLGHPGAEAVIARGLTDADWTVRAEASVAAGRIGLTGLAPILGVQLADPIWWVRFRAAESLVQLGETGVAVLRSAALKSSGVARRSAALVLAERGLSAA